MIKTFKGIFVVVICALSLFGMQTKSYASTSLIYSNDFEVVSKDHKFSDEIHKNVLFSKKTTIDLNKEVTDKTTITMWLKSVKHTDKSSFIVSLQEDPASENGVYIGIDNASEPDWLLGTGEDTIKSEHLVILDEWVFVALVNDAENKQFRAVVKDQIYAHNNDSDLSFHKLYLDSTNTMIDDLQVHDGVLSLSQLEEIKGSAIDVNRKRYEILDKKEYINSDQTKSLALQEELEQSKGELQYEVTASNLTIEKRVNSEGEFITKLKRGDLIEIKSVILPDNKIQIETIGGKRGFLASSDFYTSLINTKESSLNKFWFTYINIGSSNNSKQTVIIFLIVSMIILASLVFLLNKVINKTHVKIQGLFTPAIYLFLLYNGAFFLGEAYEIKWFLKEGWRHFPIGYTEFVHWFLFSTLIIFILVYIAQIIVIFRNLKLVKGFLTFICISASNLIGIFTIQMIISLLSSYFGKVGVVVTILFALGCIIYLKRNDFFLKADVLDIPIRKPEFYQNAKNNQRAYSNQSNQTDNKGKNNNGAQEHKKETQIDIQYFVGVTKLDDLKDRYRSLMKIYHPDNQCGDTKATEQISLEYEHLKKILQ